MKKEIAFARVATKLAVIYSAHKTDNSVRLWKKEFDGILTGGETRRLFELFSGEFMFLEATGKRTLVWSKNANPNNWTEAWVKNVFDKYGIQTQYGPVLGPDGKMLHPRTNYVRIKEAPVAETLEDKIAHIDAKIAKLNAEKEKLMAFKAAKDKLQLICDTSELSVEQLLELITYVKQGL